MKRETGLANGLLCLAAMLLAGTLPAAEPASPGFADRVLGRWDLTVQGADGAHPSWFEIRLRTETELMAEFVGRFGSRRYASAAALSASCWRRLVMATRFRSSHSSSTTTRWRST